LTASNSPFNIFSLRYLSKEQIARPRSLARCVAATRADLPQFPPSLHLSLPPASMRRSREKGRSVAAVQPVWKQLFLVRQTPSSLPSSSYSPPSLRFCYAAACLKARALAGGASCTFPNTCEVNVMEGAACVCVCVASSPSYHLFVYSDSPVPKVAYIGEDTECLAEDACKVRARACA
jgi:hypothetical protein